MTYPEDVVDFFIDFWKLLRSVFGVKVCLVDGATCKFNDGINIERMSAYTAEADRRARELERERERARARGGEGVLRRQSIKPTSSSAFPVVAKGVSAFTDLFLAAYLFRTISSRGGLKVPRVHPGCRGQCAMCNLYCALCNVRAACVRACIIQPQTVMLEVLQDGPESYGTARGKGGGEAEKQDPKRLLLQRATPRTHPCPQCCTGGILCQVWLEGQTFHLTLFPGRQIALFLRDKQNTTASKRWCKMVRATNKEKRDTWEKKKQTYKSIKTKNSNGSSSNNTSTIKEFQSERGEVLGRGEESNQKHRRQNQKHSQQATRTFGGATAVIPYPVERARARASGLDISFGVKSMPFSTALENRR